MNGFQPSARTTPLFLPRSEFQLHKTPVGELNCRIETSFAGLDGLRSTWDETVTRLSGNIYMSYDWSRIWWDFYGAGRELRIFIFTAGDEVAGIVPLYIDSLGCRPIRFRVARLVGANIPPKVFDPPIAEAWGEIIFKCILQQLFGSDRCDLLSLGPVSELHKPTEALPKACAAVKKLVAGSRLIVNGVHTVFCLPASLEAYFNGLNKSERKKRQYELRLLRRECEVNVDVLSDPADVVKEFGSFVRLHTAQWQAEGKAGHFGAWPKAEEFNESLVKAHSALGRLRFNRIFADHQLVCNQYAFAFGDTYFWELPARATGPKWDRLSLGSVGAITMIEAAIHEGKTRVEGGLGHYDYKVKLGGRQHAVRTFRVLANRFGSKMRAALFNVFRLCMLYGYHRLWYRRVSPHLPPSWRRPQWHLWLRLDF